MDAVIKNYDLLNVNVFKTREEMGKASAENVVSVINQLLNAKNFINIVFAAAPSQNDFLHHLTSSSKVDWSRVNGFHMDEYIGLTSTAPQLFSTYLNEHLFSKVKMNEVYLIDSQANPMEECARYSQLLALHPVDLVCMGIGENGHIAFNDPPVANFKDTKAVKVVELDHACRQQQVNDGCFPIIEKVPQLALTLTVPMLMSAKHLNIVVPTERKADAVFNTLLGQITTNVPASILRTHKNAKMFVDTAAFNRVAVHEDIKIC